MLALLKMELFKLVKRPMTWALLLLLCGGTGLADLIVLHNLSGAAPDAYASTLRSLTLPGIIPNTLGGLSIFAARMAAILAASSIGNEYGWGTLRPMLAAGMPRARFLAAKFLALSCLAIAFVVVPLLIGALIAVPVALAHDLPVMTGTVDVAWVGALAAMLARTLLTIVVPMTIAFLLGLVGRSQAVGRMVGEQLLTLLLSTVGQSWARTLDTQLPGNLGRALLRYNTFGAVARQAGMMSEGRAALSLLTYGAIGGLRQRWSGCWLNAT
ncbi:MAG: ABC transporter permease subunit [Chloroflexota bacterium]|nr:ABC transporter permease subunit [Chloroflexota bacterium]